MQYAKVREQMCTTFTQGSSSVTHTVQIGNYSYLAITLIILFHAVFEIT